MAAKFHLGWFTNFTSGPWKGTFDGEGYPWNGRFFIDFAQTLERACFDFILFEDKNRDPRSLWRHQRGLSGAGDGVCPQERPGPAHRAAGRGDLAYRSRLHLIDAVVPSIHAGASRFDDRQLSEGRSAGTS